MTRARRAPANWPTRLVAAARRRAIPAYVGTIIGAAVTTAGIAQWSVPFAMVVAGLAITGLSLVQLGIREARR